MLALTVLSLVSCENKETKLKDDPGDELTVETCCVPCVCGGTYMGEDENGERIYAFTAEFQVPGDEEAMISMTARRIYIWASTLTREKLESEMPDYSDKTVHTTRYNRGERSLVIRFDSDGKVEKVIKIKKNGIACAYPNL